MNQKLSKAAELRDGEGQGERTDDSLCVLGLRLKPDPSPDIISHFAYTCLPIEPNSSHSPSDFKQVTSELLIDPKFPLASREMTFFILEMPSSLF